ncbi:hypothetical protein [Yersinia phage fHe-Yen9-04]|uniref:Uncharacterized protein n=1 Tax=Yersinia phage fHe-Yen9-04 TaxID=2052742 RepID=A0A2C9CXV2_9CAUD|nr:hypothetical protein FDJ41_gp513 [Yersinia phage fHe-Yen9-04]SOK58667.1 hypothetical protein [Yersinia phage fHe-Yen9-04]VUE36436.1 hypothetical protein [Yersinia phage fHe-Yen9-04]
MSTKVILNVCNSDLEYAHSAWDGAEISIYRINEVLKERGIDIQFYLETHEEDEYPDKFWNESNPEYNPTGIEIEEHE